MALSKKLASSLTGHLSSGDRVFVAGLTGESALVRDELLQHPERAAGVEFTSIQLPGVDQTDYLSFHRDSRLRAFFMTPAVRQGMAQGRASLHPLDYRGTARYLSDVKPFDTVVAQFSLPDDNGWCTPGLTADFTPLVWQQAHRRVAHLNPRLPQLNSSFRIHASEFDVAVVADASVLTLKEPASSRVNAQIGQYAASLIKDGDTLQFGIGSVISEVALALQSHRNLRIHSGMISSFVRAMWESGCLDKTRDVVTGVVFGDAAFYDYVARHGRIRLEDVRYTHSINVLSQINRLIAINSAVEVDLFGQINAERSDGAIQAGAGGLPAFAQAAQLTGEGRLLICLPATAKKGSVSRIVHSLDTKGISTIPRYAADAVITEYGVAELRNLSVQERAKALIQVAHPEHRESLSASWETMFRRL
jgi:acyl-CoA hydrolase